MRVLIADRALLNGYTLGLAAGLRASGLETWVGGPTDSGVQSVIPIYHRSTDPEHKLVKVLEGIVGAGRFQRLLSRKPDVVHFQWPTPLDLTYALLAKRAYGLPVAYTVHNIARSTDAARNERLQRRLIALADVVLTHGPGLQRSIVDAYPDAAAKVHVVELGNYEHVIHRHPRQQARMRLGLPAEGPLYVFIGQLRPRKGVDLLLEAFAEHRLRGGKGQLLIAGTATIPAYEHRLRAIAERCDGAVHWQVSRYALPQATLDLAISAANQVVLPFQDASQSASLILAMTYGRCVVSTYTGEVPRTLEGRGILIGAGDRSALCDALVVADQNPGHCDELGDRARQYALTALAWSAIGARTARLYLDASRKVG